MCEVNIFHVNVFFRANKGYCHCARRREGLDARIPRFPAIVSLRHFSVYADAPQQIESLVRVICWNLLTLLDGVDIKSKFSSNAYFRFVALFMACLESTLIILDHSTITRLTMQVIPGNRTAPALSKELDTKIIIVLFFGPSCTFTGKPTWSTRKREKTSVTWIVTLFEWF